MNARPVIQFSVLMICLLSGLFGIAQKKIIVDPAGKGDFTTIQSALNSLTDTAEKARIIFIRKGVYQEKIFITRHNIILEGEDTKSTVITQDIARDEWRCEHPDDWGVATMNINGDDITLMNLTIANDYGFNFKEPRTVNCKTDSTGKKTINPTGHQMALRTMDATRLRAINCHFRAYAGDTVSPWNLTDGMFYFKNCLMEGGVDFYCPRGWAYAENCKFVSNSGSAAIWHDGSLNPDFKTVLKNCYFDGFPGFNLGRYHRDAQFYLVDCQFSGNMADRDIYQVPTNNTLLYGRRIYYANAIRTGGNYNWHADNLHVAPGSPAASDINADWVFDNRWKPQLDNTNNFIPKAFAGFKKLISDSVYGKNMLKETMPVTHQPNDFTVQALPYYKAEGPVWENDKIGFRLYFDQRNAKDIFGKTKSQIVLDTVGHAGDKYYHHLDAAWGMDILKVGNSLGAGALAMQVKLNSKQDTLIRLGGNVEETSYELLKNEMDHAVIRLHYRNWKVLNRSYDLTEVISIKKGKYYYESSVTIKGLKGDEKLVTGIVNLKSKTLHSFRSGTNAVMFTHDLQAENNAVLGMAIVVPQSLHPLYSSAPKTGNGITNTYLVSLKPKAGKPITFRFYANWELTDKKFSDIKNYESFLKKEAFSWNTNPGVIPSKGVIK